MKNVITMVLMLVLVAVFGCQSSSPRGGSVVKDEGFRIAVPTFSTAVKQGEFQPVIVSLDRDDYFKQDVKLQIEVPKGLSVDPAEVWVKASSKADVQLQISVSKDAAIGEYRVFVKGTPQTGEPTATEFKVDVVAP